MAAEPGKDESEIGFINGKILIVVRSESEDPVSSGDIFRVGLPNGDIAYINSANVMYIIKHF